MQPAAFVKAPEVGPIGTIGNTSFGDVPRNCFIGPHQANMDLTVGKTFRIGERQSVQFKTDFLNLTNHPSFANPPAADIEHPTIVNMKPVGVGQIVSTVGNPRFIQFSLKYSF